MIEERPEDDGGDRQEIIEESMGERSLRGEEASRNAVTDDGETVAADVSPLLTLEPSATENARENLPTSTEPDQQIRLAPLLGTSYSQDTENSGKPSPRRFLERACYAKLLHETAASPSPDRRKSVHRAPRDCYLAGAARWRTSTSSNERLTTASWSALTRWPLP